LPNHRETGTEFQLRQIEDIPSKTSASIHVAGRVDWITRSSAEKLLALNRVVDIACLLPPSSAELALPLLITAGPLPVFKFGTIPESTE
jgi:hypothetical protein